jgi:hypothetical protein
MGLPPKRAGQTRLRTYYMAIQLESRSKIFTTSIQEDTNKAASTKYPRFLKSLKRQIASKSHHKLDNEYGRRPRTANKTTTREEKKNGRIEAFAISFD